MPDYNSIAEVKEQISKLCQRLVNKDYADEREKLWIKRERTILRNQLAALERGSTSYFINWIGQR